jgi:hypothetical protein
MGYSLNDSKVTVSIPHVLGLGRSLEWVPRCPSMFILMFTALNALTAEVFGRLMAQSECYSESVDL